MVSKIIFKLELYNATVALMWTSWCGPFQPESWRVHHVPGFPASTTPTSRGPGDTPEPQCRSIDELHASKLEPHRRRTRRTEEGRPTTHVSLH